MSMAAIGGAAVTVVGGAIMNGGGGGGGYSTAGLEGGAEEALKLQQAIYDQTYADSQPFYDFGLGGMSKLSDLLGISGGSVLSRESIMSNLSPQYTTQQTTGGGDSYLYRTNDGRVIDPQQAIAEFSGRYAAGTDNGAPLLDDQISAWGLTPMQEAAQTSDVIDYDGLNAAVDAQLAGQENPDGFGSLLERFDLDKFEADAGYQYRQDESNQALERMMAAQGITLGGGGYGQINPTAAKALQEQNQNLATQEYNNAYSRYTGDNLNTYNMLMGTVGVGQGALNTSAQAGQNYANTASGIYTGLAGAQANAQIAQASQPSMFGSALSSAMPTIMEQFPNVLSSFGGGTQSNNLGAATMGTGGFY